MHPPLEGPSKRGSVEDSSHAALPSRVFLGYKQAGSSDGTLPEALNSRALCRVAFACAIAELRPHAAALESSAPAGEKSSR